MIDIGDILHVHLMKGDWVVMNRQPTLANRKIDVHAIFGESR